MKLYAYKISEDADTIRAITTNIEDPNKPCIAVSHIDTISTLGIDENIIRSYTQEIVFDNTLMKSSKLNIANTISVSQNRDGEFETK